MENEQTDKLNEEYIKKFGTLKENESIMTPEAYRAMADNLLKEYNRKYALLDSAGIETDKQVEELSTRYDKELKELKLEHERITAELKLMSDKLHYETELQSKIAAAKAEMLMDELVPADLPKRWWQRRARPNYAKQLMLRELSVEIDDYFTARVQEIETLEGNCRETDIADLLMSSLPLPRGRRARKRYVESICKIAGHIESLLHGTAADAVEGDADNQAEQAQEPEKSQDKRVKTARQLDGQMNIDELKIKGD